MSALQDALTALFVPGSAPGRFATALATAADVVILDLEDAVAAADRPAARAAIAAAVPTAASGRLLVRINAADSPELAADLDLLRRLTAEAPGVLAGVAVPKAESPEALDVASRAAGGAEVLALVETARGLDAAADLFGASATVRLAFGALDFSVDVGGDAPALLDHARIRLVLASRRAGAAQPLESPSAQIQNLDTVSAAARHAAGLGMGGMLAIHPAQLAPITGAFAPTAEQADWARRVLAAGDGAHQVDGQMVDAPVLARARRILAQDKETP